MQVRFPGQRQQLLGRPLRQLLLGLLLGHFQRPLLGFLRQLPLVRFQRPPVRRCFRELVRQLLSFRELAQRFLGRQAPREFRNHLHLELRPKKRHFLMNVIDRNNAKTGQS